jgi:hypothetical protein
MRAGRIATWSALLAMVVVGAVVLALQRQETVVLRSEIALLRDQERELAQAQAENARLKAQQISAVELERLRADHTALVRLRAEIEALQQRAPR